MAKSRPCPECGYLFGRHALGCPTRTAAPNASHTPGPWLYEKHAPPHVDLREVLWEVNATEFRGEVACGVFHEADARLIAAAPDLLAALVYVGTFIDGPLTETQREILRKRIDGAIGAAVRP